MTFESILFPPDAASPPLGDEAVPDFFVDLNLDQLESSALGPYESYALSSLFRRPLQDPLTIVYRQQVFRQLEETAVDDAIRSFAAGMTKTREALGLSRKVYYPLQKQFYFLRATTLYCETAQTLAAALSSLTLTAPGLLAARDYLATYLDGSDYRTLAEEVASLNADLAGVHYLMLVKDGSIRVTRYEGENDYSIEVARSFEKFQQAGVKSYLRSFIDEGEINHVEAAVLDMVARLHPQIFGRLTALTTMRMAFIDATLERFDREVQFYLAYADYIAPLKRAKLPFCYPTLADGDRHVSATDAFDLVLARKLTAENTMVVRNDIALSGRERILVISGPNQGGKTTFARMFGQLHYLAALGCPVPAREARLAIFDRLFTHFEREENTQTLRGKLEDDLVRIHTILEAATSRSIIIMNEIFTSTALEDALFLGKVVMDRIVRLDALCVCVTFLDELAAFGPTIVSMTSTVSPDDAARRTFRVERRPADGAAYALSIAQKYRLTYENIKERIAS